MSRALRSLLLCCVFAVACTPAPGSSTDLGRTGGASGTGGVATGGAGSGGAGSGGAGTGGMSTGGNTGTGGSAGTGGAGTGGAGTGGSVSQGGSAGTGGASVDAPVDSPVSSDGGAADHPAGAHLPNRPDIKLCAKDWTPEQCCAFLCSCLSTICADSAKAKNGIPTCMNWCPKLSDMARRCHVYHCYISISPTGGIKDHDSHCGHAADQVPGGGCPAPVYQ